MGDAGLNVSVASALGAFDGVEKVRLTVTQVNADGSAMDPGSRPWVYSRDLQRNGNVWTTSFAGVPLGHYKVEAGALDRNDRPLFDGNGFVSVTSSDTYSLTIVMQEHVTTSPMEREAPRFKSVTANKVNVNPDDSVEFLVSAIDPDALGSRDLRLNGHEAERIDADGTTWFRFDWSPTPGASGPQDVMLTLVDADGNTSAMSVAVTVGQTGAVDATMVVNLAPVVTGLTAVADTEAGATAGAYYTTKLNLSVTDGDYYSGSKGDATKKQAGLTFAWSKLSDECHGSFDVETDTFDVTTSGTSNGAQSSAASANSTVRFTLDPSTTAANAECWLQVTVTDQWLGTTTAKVQIDTSREQPFFVPNLQLSIQSHDAIENPSGFTNFDKLQFEVYADGVPNGMDASIDWEWSIGGTPIIHRENVGADLLVEALQNWFDDAQLQDIDTFGNWTGTNCDIHDFGCFLANFAGLSSAVAGTSWDATDARAYSELRWWTWQKFPCFTRPNGDVYTYVDVTASANGVSDALHFEVDVDLANPRAACQRIDGR